MSQLRTVESAVAFQTPKALITLKADHLPHRPFLFLKTKLAGRFFPALLLGLAVLLAGGCRSLTPPTRTAADLHLPSTYALETGATRERGNLWWEDFGDPRLNEFIHLALLENLTLHAYRARLAKARAQALRAGASLYPALSGELAGGAGRRHNESADRTFATETYATSLVASYEVDLWGRLAAQRQAATLTASASREDLQAVTMTMTAEIASRWVKIIAQQQQKKLLATQLATNQTYLELVALRFRQSQASAIDVLQQRQLVENARGQLPLVDLQESLLTQELAVLTGRWPSAAIDLGEPGLPELPGLPPAGLPAQLLENRPDLRAAFYRLTGADQDLVAARADLLPALSLTARAGFDSARFRTLFDNWLANLLASLTAPLLDGGRRRAEVEIAAASTQEHLANYRLLVLNALQEVEGALIREDRLTEHLQGLEKQLQISQTTLREARSRYLNGLTDYLPVLTQLLSVQALEKSLLNRREEILLARISLYRALGGSWVKQLPDSSNN